MSVIVKGMEMPTSCRECIDRRLGFRAYFGCIKGTVAPSSEERLPDCPLRPLPEKHGRLIDGDALMKTFAPRRFTSVMGDAMRILDNWPTIVEAEGEEEGSRE